LVSDDDFRDDVGFLGSLPLPQRPQSKPVTPEITDHRPARCRTLRLVQD